VEPLDGLDAAFLSLEEGHNRLHVAAVLVLDPPEGRRSLFSPTTRFAQVRRLVEERIHLVPPLRQRALPAPLGLHHPVWVDDPSFDLDDHLRRASVPAPGGPRELEELVADLLARPLELSRPLWEVVVVEGLRDERTAVVVRLHHAILDGVSGASVLAAFFDLCPHAPAPPRPVEPWAPPPLPSAAERWRHALGGLARQPERALGAVQRAVDAAVDVADHNRRLAEVGHVPPPTPFRAPRTSLNGSLSDRRRFATLAVPLDDVSLVRRTVGGTVNDVVLAAVAGAVRRLLERRGESPADPLVALVPVSTRPDDERGTLGNRVGGMLVSLATDVDDPVARLAAIARGAAVAKVQQPMTGGRLLEDLARLAPPVVSSRLARWAVNLRLFDHVPAVANLTVSSVPGPPMALFCAGARVAALYPVGPVAEGMGLNVTAMSYQDTLSFGLLGCRRLVPDVQDLAICLDDAVAELVAAALGGRRASEVHQLPPVAGER
jgi:diacylglycerol O-acyltransferase